MKKILIIHNQYRELGGEDIAVNNEVEILKEHFNVEKLYFTNNIEIEKYFSQFMSFMRNKNMESSKVVENKLISFNPDIVYVHNTWFKASPVIFQILQKNNIKTFVKLHNFRFDCTRSYLSRLHLKGQVICKACGMERDTFSLLNKYYKDSILKSLIISRFGKKYFKILKNGNINILTLTKFQKKYLENMGFNSNKITIHRNYLKGDTHTSEGYNPESDYIVYAGRVSKEKGLQILIDAFLSSQSLPFKLKILGNGPMYKELVNKYSSNEKILFLGQVSNRETKEIIKNSRAVVTATTLHEGQPTLLCEASLLGVPSIFPNNGGIKEFFPNDYELIFKNNNTKDLGKKLEMLNSKKLLESTSIRNEQFIKNLLNKDKYLDTFEKIINA